MLNTYKGDSTFIIPDVEEVTWWMINCFTFENYPVDCLMKFFNFDKCEIKNTNDALGESVSGCQGVKS